MIDFAVTVAIAVAAPTVIWWLVRLGKPPPNAAVYPPTLRVLTILGAAFFAAFVILAILANEMLGPLSLVGLLGLAGFGFFAADAFYYRLSWGPEGFAVRRLLGGSFQVNWSQVTSGHALPQDLYRLELNHPAQMFTVSTIAVGAREFIEAVHCHVRAAS